MASIDATRRYRQVQVETSAKDELLVLLLDGGVRFAEGAALELRKAANGEEEDLERRNDYLIRSQKIILELIGALNPTIGLELYDKLQSLYSFTFRRLFEGNVEADLVKVEEGVRVFQQIRDMWKDAVERAREEQDGQAKPQRPLSNSTISLQG
ncbi:MAG: flagellar export chaperone FliS [Planctomycetota bacterium]